MSQFDFKILRKPGWDLNPDDKIVNSIIRALKRNDGHCPCSHPEREGHDQCPCHEYIANGKCYCRLYIQPDNKAKSGKC